MSPAEHIKQLAQELGFALCGIAPAEPTSYREHVIEWLAAGRHGTMRYIAEHLEQRLDPAVMTPGAKSVICVADYIGPGEGGAAAETAAAQGRIARYAQVDDYHDIIKKRLHRLVDTLKQRHPEHTFRAAVDTAPVLEREHAMRAGLGWTGKNTLLIHPRIGSHVLLGEIITTMALPADDAEPDHCGTCTRCIDACPTQCITPYSVDASRCLSYLTIENRGPIDAEFHAAMGDWLYGCDICQEVCPYNQAERLERFEQPATPEKYGRRPAAMSVLDVLNWTEEDRRTSFTRSAMKRAKLDAMKRNALLVAGNHLLRQADEPLERRVRELAADETEATLVRETAASVVRRLEITRMGETEGSSSP